MKNKIIDTDLVIVGGGTLGLFIYSQLKNTIKNIKVLDRGNFEPKITKTNDIINKGIYHKGTFTKRAFGIGGNSSLWGGQLAEFTKTELAEYESELGLRKNETTKLYKRVYKLLNVKRNDLNNFVKDNKIKIPNKYSIKYFHTNWLNEPNFSKLYKKKIYKNSSDFITNAKAKKLFIRNKNITAIEYTIKKKKYLLRAKKYIFACGTVETIKFFHKNNKVIKSNNIGSYFHDHLGIHVGNVFPIDNNKFSKIFFNGIYNNSKYQPKLLFRSDNSKYSLAASGEFKFYSKYQDDLKQLKMGYVNFINEMKFIYLITIIKKAIKLNFKFLELLWAYILKQKIKPFYDKGIYFYIQSEQISERNSSIKFNKLNKKFSINWKISKNELDFIKQFAYQTKIFLEKEKIAKLNINKFKNINYNKFKKVVRDTNHPSGGMIISNDRNKGVVDRKYCVWGTKNLYIAGSCLFKKSSYANITFTSLALALKLTDYIKKNV